jgi:pimeloyl-ACP methyl ester carboxylesterase
MDSSDFFAPGAPTLAKLGAAALAEFAILPAAEFGLLLADPVYWGLGVPRGDRHSVLVLPGLFAGDGYLQPLRRWLWRVGYTPLRSGLKRNPGWSPEVVHELGELAQGGFLRSGQRVSIIGHSLGGLIGRSVALRYPRAIRHVITLGSPLMMSRGVMPESVRITALYSRSDRIVRHPGALARDPNARNVEVRGSHVGLTGNPQVYRLLGSLLHTSPPS